MKFNDLKEQYLSSINITQIFWIFMIIFPLSLLILLQFLPGFHIPIDFLSLSIWYNGIDQMPGVLILLLMVIPNTILHYIGSKRTISLSLIFSFALFAVISYEIFNATHQISLFSTFLLFILATMVFLDSVTITSTSTTESTDERTMKMKSNKKAMNNEENLIEELERLEQLHTN